MELSSLYPGLFLGSMEPGVGEGDNCRNGKWFCRHSEGPGVGRKGVGEYSGLSGHRHTEAGIGGRTQEGPVLAGTPILLLAEESWSNRE